MNILLTNDDGPSSPFLLPLVQALSQASWCDELRVVIPAEEQSWIAQAMTRFRPLYAYPRTFHGISGNLVSGTPADCVTLGINSLYADKADLVISGINVGTNAGLPFYLCSGTVGGARQAMLFGVFSMAFSVRVPDSIFDQWRDEDSEALAKHAADWNRLARLVVSLISRCHGLAGNKLDMLLFDLPWEATEKSELKLTLPERRTYGPLHRRAEDGGYLHQFSYLEPSRGSSAASEMPGDLSVAGKDTICVTPIHYEFSVSNEALLTKLTQSLGLG